MRGHAIAGYRPEDRGDCVALLEGLPEWFDAGDVAHALRHLTPEETRLIRDADGTLLGILSSRRLPLEGAETPYVDLVAVRSGCMGRGVGRELMAEAERLAGPGSRLWLEMLEEDASVPRYRKRRSFYESLGYRTVAVYPSDSWGPGCHARSYAKETPGS